MAARTLAAWVVLVVVGHAQDVQRELIGWRELRAVEFATPPSRMMRPANTSRLAAISAKLEKDRAPMVKALSGREFYGLCELVKVRPYRSKVRTLEFVLWERQKLDEESKVGATTWDLGGFYLLQLKVLVPMAEARSYGVGDVLNVSGKVASISFDDWNNVVMGGDGNDPIITVTLHEAEF